MATLTAYPDAGTGATTVDGYVGNYLLNGLSWANITAGTGGTLQAGASDAVFAAIYALTKNAAEDGMWINFRRGVFLFNTAALTADATITAATLTVTQAGKANNLTGSTPAFNIYAVTPASNNALVGADLNTFGTTPFSTTVAYSALPVNDTTVAFALNAAGLAAISKTGITKFGIREVNYDVAGVAPPWTQNASYRWSLYGADQADPTSDPKLVITYTLPSSSSALGLAKLQRLERLS